MRAISERRAGIVAARSFVFRTLEGGPDSLEPVRGHLGGAVTAGSLCGRDRGFVRLHAVPENTVNYP